MQLTSNFATLALALGAISASALPSPKPAPRTGATVDIPLVRNAARLMTRADGSADLGKISSEVARLRAKYSKNLASFERNTGKKHAMDKRDTIAARGVGRVPLGDQSGGQLWSGPISFGTPAQQIYIDFDTGSSDTLVNPSAYDPNQSSTSQDTGTTFRDGYGDGTQAYGEVYQDALSIAGLSAPTAYIGLSQSQFVGGNEGNNQGISGMAFPNLAAFQQQTPYFYSLINAGALDQQAFTFKLRSSGSSLTLGSKSSSATYVPVTDASYWTVDAQVNGQSTSGIVDSGTTVIVAPVADAKALYSQLGLQSFEQDQQWQAVFDCNSPPSVTFSFGSKSITLGDTVSYGTTNDGQCVFSVIGANIGQDGWTFGDSIFQETVISFDVENQQVGFE